MKWKFRTDWWTRTKLKRNGAKCGSEWQKFVDNILILTTDCFSSLNSKWVAFWRNMKVICTVCLSTYSVYQFIRSNLIGRILTQNTPYPLALANPSCLLLTCALPPYCSPEQLAVLVTGHFSLFLQIPFDRTRTATHAMFSHPLLSLIFSSAPVTQAEIQPACAHSQWGALGTKKKI